MDLQLSGNGTITFAPDRFSRENGALYLNKTYYSTPSGVYFNGPFTIMGWIKLITLDLYSCFMSFGNGPRSDNVYMCLSSGEGKGPYFGLWQANTSISIILPPQPLAVDSWMHYCATWDGTNATIYLNGSLLFTDFGYGQVRNVVRNECYFGRNNWPSNPFVNAYFDDIRIYNRFEFIITRINYFFSQF